MSIKYFSAEMMEGGKKIFIFEEVDKIMIKIILKGTAH